jgi:hypothetical protein
MTDTIFQGDLRATLPGGDHVERYLGGIFSQKLKKQKRLPFVVFRQGNPTHTHYSIKDPTDGLWHCDCGYVWQEGDIDWSALYGNPLSPTRGRKNSRISRGCNV